MLKLRGVKVLRSAGLGITLSLYLYLVSCYQGIFANWPDVSFGNLLRLGREVSIGELLIVERTGASSLFYVGTGWTSPIYSSGVDLFPWIAGIVVLGLAIWMLGFAN